MRIGLYNRLEDLLSDSGYETFKVRGIYVCALHGPSAWQKLGSEKPRTIIVNVFPLPVWPYAKIVPL